MKTGPRADVGDGVGGGGERQRGHEHLVARADAERRERQVQCGGAARQRDGVRNADDWPRTRARTRQHAARAAPASWSRTRPEEATLDDLPRPAARGKCGS